MRRREKKEIKYKGETCRRRGREGGARKIDRERERGRLRARQQGERKSGYVRGRGERVIKSKCLSMFLNFKGYLCFTIWKTSLT